MMHKQLLSTLLASLLLYSCQSANRGDKLVITAHISPSASVEQWEAVKKILNERLINLGAQDIKLDELDSMLTITMYTEVDTSAIRTLIEKKGLVQIVETHDNVELFPLLLQVNRLMVDAKIFSSDYNAELNSSSNEFPLFNLLDPSADNSGNPIRTACIGYATASDTASINQVFSMPGVMALLPKDLKIAFSIKPTQQDPALYEVIAAKNPAFGSMAVDNSMIERAKVEKEKYTGNQVILSFKKEYHEYWKNMTESNIGRSLAILIDGKVTSSPSVVDKIEGGKAAVATNFTKEDAEILAAIVSYPPLPAAVHVQAIEVFAKNKK